jgi:WD40 repeat protein
MSRRSAILIAAMLLVPMVSHPQPPALKFVKKIGVGFQTGSWGWMSFVAFSPDGSMVASDGPTTPTDVSGNITIWSFPEGRLIKQLPVRSFVISGDWKYYASPYGVKEMETGKSLISVSDKVYPGYTFSPDSRYVAESARGKGSHNASIRIIELATGKQVCAFGSHSPFSIAISPDGVTLAAGYWDAVALWNIVTGRRIALLSGFGRYVEGLAFSRDGKLLAAGTDLGGLRIWDVQHQTRLQSLAPAGGYQLVSEPAFSPDGRLVAVGIYGTGTVWLIDVTNGKVLDHKKVSDLGCGSVAFSPDGRYLITPSTGGLITWPYDSGGTIRVFEVSTH